MWFREANSILNSCKWKSLRTAVRKRRTSWFPFDRWLVEDMRGGSYFDSSRISRHLIWISRSLWWSLIFELMWRKIVWSGLQFGSIWIILDYDALMRDCESTLALWLGTNTVKSLRENHAQIVQQNGWHRSPCGPRISGIYYNILIFSPLSFFFN